MAHPQGPDVTPASEDNSEEPTQQCRCEGEFNVWKMYEAEQDGSDDNHNRKRPDRKEVPDNHGLHQELLNEAPKGIEQCQDKHLGNNPNGSARQANRQADGYSDDKNRRGGGHALPQPIGRKAEEAKALRLTLD